MLRLFKNKEIKVYIVLMFIVHLGLGLFIYSAYTKNTKVLQQTIIEERVALLGNIIANHPHLESEIIPFITENASEEQIEQGLKVARRYGIDYNMPIQSSPLLLNFQRKNNLNILYAILLFFILVAATGVFILNYIYSRIRKFSNYAEAIVEGKFDTISESQEEGDFAILTVQYNHMAKRLQGSLESLQQEKVYLKNIVSDISHQLKTPLSSVKMFNELLMDGEIEDLRVSNEFLAKSQSQIERMEWLIKNLLKMARVETNSVEFKKKFIPINETIREAIGPLQVKCEEKGQQLNYEDKDILVKHDKEWMAEAISNIVKNAIEHTPSKGSITISTAETPLAVEIQIDNQGNPIPQGDIPRLFERFYKGENNPTPNSTGIGLALAKAIVENQNGTIEVRNKQEGPSFIILLYKYDSF